MKFSLSRKQSRIRGGITSANPGTKYRDSSVGTLYACPVCGQTDTVHLYSAANYDLSELSKFGFASRKIPEYMHYTMMECDNCKLLFAVDTLNQDQISKLYKQAGFDSQKEAEFASKTYLKYLKSRGDYPKKSAMDIGTGEGSFLHLLLEDGAKKVLGIEPSLAPIRVAGKDVQKYIRNSIFDPTDYAPESFDLITCFQTLEHIPNTLNVLSGIYTLLEKNGLFFAICHDYTSFINRVFREKSPIFDIEHLQIFSQTSIKIALEESGFCNVTAFKIKNIYPLNYWVKLLPIPKQMKKQLLKFLTITRLDRLTLAFNVGNFAVLAYK